MAVNFERVDDGENPHDSASNADSIESMDSEDSYEKRPSKTIFQNFQ